MEALVTAKSAPSEPGESADAVAPVLLLASPLHDLPVASPADSNFSASDPSSSLPLQSTLETASTLEPSLLIPVASPLLIHLPNSPQLSSSNLSSAPQPPKPAGQALPRQTVPLSPFPYSNRGPNRVNPWQLEESIKNRSEESYRRRAEEYMRIITAQRAEIINLRGVITEMKKRMDKYHIPRAEGNKQKVPRPQPKVSQPQHSPPKQSPPKQSPPKQSPPKVPKETKEKVKWPEQVTFIPWNGPLPLTQPRVPIKSESIEQSQSSEQGQQMLLESAEELRAIQQALLQFEEAQPNPEGTELAQVIKTEPTDQIQPSEGTSEPLNEKLDDLDDDEIYFADVIEEGPELEAAQVTAEPIQVDPSPPKEPQKSEASKPVQSRSNKRSLRNLAQKDYRKMVGAPEPQPRWTPPQRSVPPIDYMVLEGGEIHESEEAVEEEQEGQGEQDEDESNEGNENSEEEDEASGEDEDAEGPPRKRFKSEHSYSMDESSGSLLTLMQSIESSKVPTVNFMAPPSSDASEMSKEPVVEEEVYKAITNEYICHLCPKSYAQKGKLKAHVQKYHAEQFDILSSVFSPKSSIHKAHPCPFEGCQHGFSQTCSLNRHMRTVHKVELKHKRAPRHRPTTERPQRNAPPAPTHGPTIDIPSRAKNISTTELKTTLVFAKPSPVSTTQTKPTSIPQVKKPSIAQTKLPSDPQVKATPVTPTKAPLGLSTFIGFPALPTPTQTFPIFPPFPNLPTLANIKDPKK